MHWQQAGQLLTFWESFEYQFVMQDEIVYYIRCLKNFPPLRKYAHLSIALQPKDGIT